MADELNVKPIIEPTVEPTVEPTSTPTIFDTIKEKYGREIDEDYLANDYKANYSQLESSYNELKTKADGIKHIIENPDLMLVAEHMKNGVGIKEALEALTINPDSLPADQLIYDAVARKNPYIKDKDVLETLLQRQYGIGEDMDEMKVEDFDRYLNVLKNREEAQKEQKEFLNGRRIELTKPKEIQQPQEQENFFSEERIQQSKNFINNEVEKLQNFKIGEIEKPFDKSVLSQISDSIIFSGNFDGVGDKVSIINGYTPAEITEAIYLLKNKEAHLNEFVNEISKVKSVEAIKKADEMYNNVGSKAKEVPTTARMARMVDMSEQN